MNELVAQLYQRIWEGQPELLSAIERLETNIGYRFERRELLFEAVTHRSMAAFGRGMRRADKRAGAQASPRNVTSSQVTLPWNERLEFLGDAVLGLVISTILVARQELFAEGELSRLRASLVNEDTLAGIAQELGMGDALLLGKGERKGGGACRKSLLADALEALIGGVYEDGGFEAARAVVSSLYGERLSGTLSPLLQRDFKTMLQELTQERSKGVPTYRVVSESGPDHAKLFEVEVVLHGNVLGAGSGDSKKRASQIAAREAYAKLTGAPA